MPPQHPSAQGPNVPASTLDVLVDELRAKVVRHGLPVRVPDQSSMIFELPSVRAHALSDDLLDRTAALDGLLRRILVHHFGEGPDGKAASALFAFASGTKGLTLTARRARCAEIHNVHPDHWRKNLEPKLLRALAYELYLLDRHYRPRLSETTGHAVPLVPNSPTDTPEALARHELESRIMAHLYGQRAELAAVYQAVRFDKRIDFDEHADLALWEYTQLTVALAKYVDT